MAQDTFADFDATSSNNSTVEGDATDGSVDISEGCLPGNINNAIRAIMAAANKAFGDLPSGTSRPSYLTSGKFWKDTTTAATPIIKFYDGTDDITVFTVDTSANSVAFAGVTSGMEFIASQDLSAAATADFTGFDSTKYDAYVFKLMNVYPGTDNVRLLMRTSTDGGSSYDSGASDYDWVSNRLHDNSGATLSTDGSFSDTSIRLAFNLGNTAGTDDGYSGTVEINGPHLAKKTHVAFHGSGQDVNGNLVSEVGSGIRQSSADVDAVRFLFSSGNIASGTITMYGLRNAA